MEAISKGSRVEKIVKLTLITVAGSILITISAKAKIPFYPVPMTMQTFVVLFLGITLGPRIGLLTISLYLFEGIFIFAEMVRSKVPNTATKITLAILFNSIFLIASMSNTIQLFLMKSSFL